MDYDFIVTKIYVQLNMNYYVNITRNVFNNPKFSHI